MTENVTKIIYQHILIEMIIFLSYLGYFVVTTVNALQRRFVIKRKNAQSLEQIHFAFEVMCILVLGSIIMQFFSPLHFNGSVLLNLNVHQSSSCGNTPHQIFCSEGLRGGTRCKHRAR